jgi:hypothetical protein
MNLAVPVDRPRCTRPEPRSATHNGSGRIAQEAPLRFWFANYTSAAFDP